MKKCLWFLSILFLFQALFLCADIQTETLQNRSPKRLNILVYFAGNNNLHDVCIKQLNQMAEIGSTDEVNFIAQLDIYKEKGVKRYFIEKNSAIAIESIYENVGVPTASVTPEAITGTPESLTSFVQWGMENFPADDLYLIISNHGDGIKDQNHYPTKDKGIGLNDYAKRYLTNQDLEKALGVIAQTVLGGKKISLLLTDACLMSMVEVCSQIKQHVDVFVGSQDIEPSLGYDYTKLFGGFHQSFKESLFKAQAFAEYSVKCYLDTHKSANRPVTQSAINLASIEKLEENLAQIGRLCAECITLKRNFFETLKEIRRNNRVTFYDPDYIDLWAFYENLITYIEPELSSNSHRRRDIVKLAREGVALLNELIVANATGALSRGARGLSIYFPEFTIHSSYIKTIFNQRTNWSNFLQEYVYLNFYKHETIEKNNY